jgi:hypothetical protein
MAKQIIDIGVQGNDGTGDSIRDSFRKVNENFNEIYSIFGQGRITFSQLGDGTEYSGNQLIMGSVDGSTLTARTIIPGTNIDIVIADDAESNAHTVTFSSRAAKISDDISPEIKFPLNINLKPIGRVPDPSQEIVDAFNLVWDAQTTFDQLPVNVGYANRNYVRLTADGTIGIVDSTGVIVPGPVNARNEPTLPDTTNPAYDSTLSGNYLSTEVLPRKNAVYRGGDTMTGPLYLSDHPKDLAGVVGANTKEDLQAATAFYVDNKTFTSTVNLFVSTSGDDLQSRTPVGKEGRYWNYAFKSFGSALLHAQSLISIASQEPGPYKQRVSYTVGPDQSFSTIQKVTLTGGNSGTASYVSAFNLLQANREFIQAETIAYINKKYVNPYVYNHAELASKISSLLTSIGNDVLLGSTNPNSSVSGTNYNSYWEGVSYIHDYPTSDGLIQWVETIKFVRDQIIDFSYNPAALQTYTGQIIDALAYDALFQSNYQSIQAGIAFKNANTKISATELASMLTVNPITLVSAVCNGSIITITFATQSSIIYPVGSRVHINATFTSKTITTSPVTLTSLSGGAVISYIVTAATASSISFDKGTTGLIVDQFTVVGTIDRHNLINILLLTPAVKNLPVATALIKANTKLIAEYVVDGILPNVSYPAQLTPLGKAVSFTDSGDLVTLLNHSFANGDIISFEQISITTGISIQTNYYVVNRTTNNFKLATSLGGSAIPLTTNGTGRLTWDPIGHASAKQLLLENIAFIQAETLAFLSSEYPNVIYDRALSNRDVKYVIWSLVYDLTYGGNSQSVYAAKQYWPTPTTSYLNSSEKEACIAAIRNISSLVRPIIANDIVGVTYQQSVRQYRNDTLLQGEVATDSVTNNVELIATIVTDFLNVPVSIAYPNILTSAVELQTVFTAIETTRSVYTTGLTTSTSWYMDQFYPVINDTDNQDKIATLFQTIIDIVESGSVPTQLPSYPLLTVTVNTGITTAMISQARSILTYSVISTIATDTVSGPGGIVATYGPGTASNITINVPKLIQEVNNIVVAICYDITFGGTTASFRAAQQLSIIGSTLITQDVINTARTKTLSYITGNITGDTTNKVALLIDTKFNSIIGVLNLSVTEAVPVNLETFVGSTYTTSIRLRNLILSNITAITTSTTTYVSEKFAGGFVYDESRCFRDIGNIIDGLSIDLITGGTLQSVTSGKSFYKNASARTIAVGGTHYLQSLDALQFATRVGLQVLTKTSAIRYQLIAQVYSFSSISQCPSASIGVTGTTTSVTDETTQDEFLSGMQTITNIIQFGISAASTPSYGTGIWHIAVDNGGRGFVDQGSPLNNDIFPAKVVVGVGAPAVGVTPSIIASEAYASIVKYAPGEDTSGVGVLPDVDTIQVRLTKPGFFKVNEQLEFGETVQDLNITIFVESGIYYEDYPLRLPPNVSIRGDEMRRTLIRPKDRISQSPWRKIFFYRDAVIDGLEVGLVDYTGTNYAPEGITATLDGVTNKIVVTLSDNYQALLSWVGKVVADTNVTNGNAKRGKAVIDSVSGNTFNCTVIYPFTNAGLYEVNDWKIFGTINYGRHYLTNPLDVTSTAKNNKLIDVFLCNEGNRIIGVTFQGHGGFGMVLDPEGNIKTKSPYIQECSSFSQSNNYKRFAGGMFIDGFAGRVYGTITQIEDYGLTITVVGETNSGLDIRPPQPPCSFYVRGKRYQIDDIVSFDATSKTVVLRLNTSTTYMYDPITQALSYDEVKAQRDVGYVLDAAATDVILGTNYRSVHAGRAFLRPYSSALIGGLQDLTVAGINKATSLGNEYFSNTSILTDNVRVVTSMLSNGVNATPTLTWSTSATADNNKVRDIIQLNKSFINSEISSWIASNFTLSNYPQYNVLTSERDIGYIVDAITYDVFYGGNSQTYDSAISFYFNGTAIIQGITLVCAGAQTRLKTILGYIINANTSWIKSPGNNLTQITANPPSSPASYVTSVNSLCDLLIDYIADGAFTSAPTVVFPTLAAGANTTAYNTMTAAMTTIATTVTTFLNNGANLRVNLETGGNRSMLGNDFAMLNDLAYGVIATNGAFTEQVCTFTYYAHTGLWANNGSNVRGVGCSNTFGNYGMRASGYDVTELPDSTNLANHMIQTARVYKQGLVSTEMTPTATSPAIALWIIGYDYIPTNGANLEIDHTVNGGIITKYSITSVEYTTIQVSNQIVLKLNLSSSGESNTTTSGLAKELYHGQVVTIRSMKNMKFINVDNVKPTRPSTALQYNDNLNDVYRIIAYNLTESTGDLLGNNIAILQSDNSFAYYSFYVDPINIINGDPNSSITATIVSGSTSSTTITVNNVVGTILPGHTITGIGFAGQTVLTVSGSGTLTLTLSATPTSTPTQSISFSFVTQGSKIGDTKIAISQISQLAVINQINKGTYITAWNGRLHRVLRYVSPTFAAIRTFVGYVSTTLTVSGSAGTIEDGSLIIGKNAGTSVIEFIGTVVSSTYNSTSALTEVVVSGGTGSPSAGSIFSFGVNANGYIEVSSNAIINNSADGTAAPAMSFNSSTLQTGSVVNKVVTFDVPYNKYNLLPKVDSFITVEGNSNTAYNGSHRVTAVVDQTTLTIGSTTGYVAGMVVTSQVTITTIASNLFTTSISHQLVVNDPITSTSTTNGLDSTVTYYVKTTPAGTTFTLSASAGGPQLTTFTNGTSLQIAIQTPKTARMNSAGSIVQSVNPTTNEIVVSPSCWAPNGSPIRATLAASVLRIDVTTGGSGYDAAPLLTIEGGSPTQQATATCTIVNGTINEVKVVLRGYGYTTQPTVTITPAPGTVFTGTPAVLTVVLSTPVYIDSTSSSGITVTQMSLLYSGDPGTFGTNTSKNVTAAGAPTEVTYNSVAGYSVAFTCQALSETPTVDTWYQILGNSNTLYNGFVQVISAADTTHATVFYPFNPGTYGSGTTTISKANTAGTSSTLGISKPFDTNSSYTLVVGYAINVGAQVTTRISTCRATGHDFCDIGTGGYSTTNIPYSIYGEPALSRQISNETLDEGVGRCFYVSTNQDGIFRVGRFFSVDQGTGTVTFSAKISLSNIEGFGFSRGVVVNEFSSDSSMTNNAADSVPVQSAVRGYIDKRLGLDHGGSPLPFASFIGPGFMPLNGGLTMIGDLPLGGHRITGVLTPAISTDAATKGYVDDLIDSNNTILEMDDVNITVSALSSAQVLIYDTVTSKWLNETVNGDVSLSFSGGILTASIGSSKIVNSMVSTTAQIAQSKLSLSAASTRANATGIAQVDLGVASFNSAQFVATNGWIELLTSTTTSTGVTIDKLQFIPNSTILGNLTTGTGNSAVTTLTPGAIVTAGDGVKNASFTSVGVMVASTITSGKASAYTVIGYTTTGENSKIVQTGALGEIDTKQLKVDGYKIVDTVSTALNTPATTKLVLTTPGNFDFLTSVGDANTNNITTVYGTLDISGTNNTLKSTTLTTGATATSGTITGTWELAAGSSLDTSNGTFNSSAEGLTASVSRPKIRPSVIFDFANSRTLDPRITFVRNTIGTYYNEEGILKTAVAGQPRFDYDPVTGVSNGLLLEEPRTNQLTFSATFETTGAAKVWTDTSIDRTLDSGVIAPDGTTAIKFAALAANAIVAISGSVTTGPVYRTFSVWLQRVAGTGIISITMDNGTNWYPVTITSTLTRYTFTNSTSDNRVAIKIATSGDSIIMWGAQLEDGAFVTSYIPTTTLAVLRNSDDAYVDGNNFSSWYRSDEGTLIVSHSATAIDISATVNDYGAATIANINTSSVMSLRCSSNGSGSLVYDAYGTSASLTQFNFTGLTTSTVNSVVTHALSYKANLCAYSYDGTVAETDNLAIITSSMIRLNIGNNAGAQTIARFAYYPKQLTNAEIQSITTQ